MDILHQSFSKYGEGITIGNNSAFGKFTEFGAAGGIQIGSDVIAGSYISFHSENHVFQDPSRLIREQGVTSKGILIGNNVWIGMPKLLFRWLKNWK